MKSFKDYLIEHDYKVAAVKMKDGSIHSDTMGHSYAIQKAFRAKFKQPGPVGGRYGMGNPNTDPKVKEYNDFHDTFYHDHEHGVRGFHPLGKPKKFIDTHTLDDMERFQIYK